MVILVFVASARCCLTGVEAFWGATGVACFFSSGAACLGGLAGFVDFWTTGY